MTATCIAPGSVVAVIGSGAMGAGIAQVASAAGHTVKLFDTRAGAAQAAIDGIGKAFCKLVVDARMDAADAAAATARLQGVASLADVADAALVIEAIVESQGAKRALFAELETVVGEGCILATNTSSISVTAIGAHLARPERLVGMHFFNPAPVMALVEVVSGLATDAAIAAAVFATAAAWGKTPVHARSTPGFIVNRVARPYYAESLRMLGEGAASVASIDAVLREAGGFRMGPFELMDLIGHDVNFAVTESVFQAFYHDPRYTPSVIQRELVDAGYLGRKSGRGFYRYGADAVNPPVQTEAPQPFSGALSHGALSGALARRFAAHGITLAAGGVDAHVIACGDARICLTDGRSATARAADSGHPDTVLYDLAFDYATAQRIALAPADQCSAAAWQAALGLFQAAGFAVTRFDDVPGLAVMRTVAMLANAAADAVHHGVCSAADADLAMRQGVNYPCGPLAWADQIGIAHIVTVLQHLADGYGKDRYRVSPLLRRYLAAGRNFYRDDAVGEAPC